MSLSLHFTHDAGPAGAPGPVVILHGLFGSSRNWTGAAKEIAKFSDVYCLDQRNHGDSPHTDSHTLLDLREDLHDWMQEHQIERPLIIGHSMGGMAAMAFALKYPQELGGLVVVDIAPRDYPPHHQKEFEALSLDVSQCASRSDVDARMSEIIDDRMVRQFLQMNLERLESDRAGYRWKLNVPALKAATHTEGLTDMNEHDGRYDGPTLFLRGGDSDYIREADFARIQELFPQAEIQTIAGHGHWLHYTAGEQFLKAVHDFAQQHLRGNHAG